MYGETCTVLYTAPHVQILCERKSRNQLSSITNYIKSYKLVLQSLSQELKIFPRNRERGKKKRKKNKNRQPPRRFSQGRLRGRICSHPSGKSPSYLTCYMELKLGKHRSPVSLSSRLSASKLGLVCQVFGTDKSAMETIWNS